MKKKLVGTMMAFALMAGSIMPVSAAEVVRDGETADVQIEYDNPSTFCVNIPESINLNDSEGYKFTASMMNLTESEKVCIYAPTESIPMYNEMGAVGNVHLYSNDSSAVATFMTGQMESNTVMYSMFDGLSAGHFTGTATFTIRLESTK